MESVLVVAEPAAFWRSLASDSQLRWLGPEKGVIHISMAAIVNAVCDALEPFGVRHVDMPCTPGRVWDAMQGKV